MKLLLEQLAQLTSIEQATIVSLDMSLYQLYVTLDGREQMVWKTPTQPLISRALSEMRDLIKALAIGRVHLRHDSAYDEMINQPPRQTNTLTLDLRAGN